MVSADGGHVKYTGGLGFDAEAACFLGGDEHR
jgi:hypothetical protein